MAGYVLPSPKFNERDDNGEPLAAGLVYLFLAGTSTPAVSYADAALTIPNAHPVVLDGAGRATIFVADTSAASYLVVVKTAAGVVVYSQDDVSVPQTSAPPISVSTVPAGAILPYGGATAPAGYLLCDGTAVSRVTYATLFTAISTTFGVGNGSTTFNVPDLRQRFPLGQAASGTGAVLGATGGTIDHVHTGPSHTHTSPSHAHAMAHTHVIPRDGWDGIFVAGLSTDGRLLAGDAVTNNLTHAQNDVTSGGSSAANTTAATVTVDAGGTGNTGSANPAFLAVQFIIKH